MGVHVFDALVATLTAIEAGRDDVRPLLRDQIEEAWPAQVLRGCDARLNWLRLAVARQARTDPAGWQRPWRCGSSAFAALAALRARLQELAGFDILDHFGTTTLDGLPCLIGEPYRAVERLVPLMADASAAIGLVVECGSWAEWSPSCSRVWIFPSVAAIGLPWQSGGVPRYAKPVRRRLQECEL